MSLRNTTLAYGSVAKTLHWAIAVLFLVAYIAVYYRRWFTVAGPPGTANYTALQIHLAAGVSIFAFVILRTIWRWSNPPPAPAAGTHWEHVAAHATHRVLYFVMILMPITGYLGTGANTDYFNISQFRNTALYEWIVTDKLAMDWEAFEAPIDFVHKKIGGALLVWVLIVMHAGAALYHHFVKRDEVLVRMWPVGRRKQ